MGPNQTGLENIIRFRFLLIQTWKNIARLLTELESIFVTQETTYICKHPWAISFFSTRYDIDTILGFFSRYDTIRYNMRALGHHGGGQHEVQRQDHHGGGQHDVQRQ